MIQCKLCYGEAHRDMTENVAYCWRLCHLASTMHQEPSRAVVILWFFIMLGYSGRMSDEPQNSGFS